MAAVGKELRVDGAEHFEEVEVRYAVDGDARSDLRIRWSGKHVHFVAEAGHLLRDVVEVDALTAGVHLALVEEEADPHAGPLSAASRRTFS